MRNRDSRINAGTACRSSGYPGCSPCAGLHRWHATGSCSSCSVPGGSSHVVLHSLWDGRVALGRATPSVLYASHSSQSFCGAVDWLSRLSVCVLGLSARFNMWLCELVSGPCVFVMFCSCHACCSCLCACARWTTAAGLCCAVRIVRHSCVRDADVPCWCTWRRRCAPLRIVGASPWHNVTCSALARQWWLVGAAGRVLSHFWRMCAAAQRSALSSASDGCVCSHGVYAVLALLLRRLAA